MKLRALVVFLLLAQAWSDGQEDHCEQEKSIRDCTETSGCCWLQLSLAGNPLTTGTCALPSSPQTVDNYCAYERKVMSVENGLNIYRCQCHSHMIYI